MKPRLKTLLMLQLAYCVVGVGYNIISYVVVVNGGPQLSTTPPLFGGMAMSAYGLMLIPGFMDKLTPYRILMGISILIYGFGGIYKHLSLYFSTGLDGYQSYLSWLLAWTINVYGLILNAMAAAGLYKRQ